MNYLKLSTMEYPRFEGDIRLEHPEISEDQTGDTFSVPADYVLVTMSEMPVLGKDQYLTETMPVQQDGQWVNVWVVNDMTPEQIAAREEMIKKQQPKRMATDVNGAPPDVI